MKIYQIHASTKLICKSRDVQFLADEKFSGCPFPDKWKRVELGFEGKATQVDFHGFGSKALVCSERVTLWAGALWDEGEFLPVKIAGRKGKYYIYNITHCTSHLNPKKTIWLKSKAGTESRSIKSPAFHAERLGEDCVFKIPEDGATAIYALERDDVPGHESLKKLVKRHGLTGLKFKLVWSDEKKRSLS